MCESKLLATVSARRNKMTNFSNKSWLKRVFYLPVIAVIFSLGVTDLAADEPANASFYDESTYTEYVENTMKELDSLYLEFCSDCGVDGSKAWKARMEFYTKVRDLMKQMNARFDSLDPKTGAALSPTETLVSIHVLTMLVDILTASQLEDMTAHPYIE
jgi:hypothetical protein